MHCATAVLCSGRTDNLPRTTPLISPSMLLAAVHRHGQCHVHGTHAIQPARLPDAQPPAQPDRRQRGAAQLLPRQRARPVSASLTMCRKCKCGASAVAAYAGHVQCLGPRRLPCVEGMPHVGVPGLWRMSALVQRRHLHRAGTQMRTRRSSGAPSLCCVLDMRMWCRWVTCVCCSQ